MTSVIDCNLCAKRFIGFGNNPYPLCDFNDYKARCCDECNFCKVLPARIMEMKLPKAKANLWAETAATAKAAAPATVPSVPVLPPAPTPAPSPAAGAGGRDWNFCRCGTDLRTESPHAYDYAMCGECEEALSIKVKANQAAERAAKEAAGATMIEGEIDVVWEESGRSERITIPRVPEDDIYEYIHETYVYNIANWKVAEGPPPTNDDTCELCSVVLTKDNDACQHGWGDADTCGELICVTCMVRVDKIREAEDA